MAKYLMAAIALAMSSLASANDIRYTYVEGGFYFWNDEEKEEGNGYYDEFESSLVLGQFNGSVGFGSLFYLPASIEAQSVVTEYEFCDYDFNYCDKGETSSFATLLNVGAGLHFDMGQNVSLYTEVGLLSRRIAYDYDYDSDDYDFDEDETNNDSGVQQVIGLRIQPGDLVELNIGAQRIDLQDNEDVFFRKNFSVQFNISQSIGIGVKTIVVSEKLNKFDEKFWGGYFRYSFK